MLTGSLTIYFVKDKKENNPIIDFIQSEKKRLELLLQEFNKE